MLSSPLGISHGRMTSGVACYHRLWEAHTVERCQAWHDITSLGQHTRSDYVGCGMTSPPLDSTHGRMMSGMACHHRPWTAYTVGRRQAWHDITSFGQHTRSTDVGREMPSPPLYSTLGQTTSGMAFHYPLWAAQTVEQRRAWNDITALALDAQSDEVGRSMPSSPLGSINGGTTSGVA